MADPISERNVGGTSTWDVHFELKEGEVDLEDPYRENLAKMLSEGSSTKLPEGLRWERSLGLLLDVFQKHVDEQVTIFQKVQALHFLKLSLHRREVGGRNKFFFAFTTQFMADENNEQEYIDDMYGGYGWMMEVVWRHCKNVTALVENPNGPAPYELADEFVALVKANKVDNHAAVCFFVKNWNTPPDSIPRWKKRSGQLSKAGQKVGIARQLLKEPQPDHETILKNLMQDLDGIPV